MKMNKIANNNQVSLSKFPPFLQKHIEDLFLNRWLTLEEFTLNDITPVASLLFIDSDTNTYSYYYNFKIPYAGRRLNWTVIFNPDDLSFAPDFDFNDDEFLYDPDINRMCDQLPSLLNWDVNDPKLLGGVLEEFLALYRKFSFDKLANENIYSYINNELQKLIQHNVVNVNDVEITVNTSTVYLLINMKIDTSTLPNYMQPQTNGENSRVLNPGKDKVTLKVHFIKLDGSRVNSSLYLSPLLEQIVGGNRNLFIPSYHSKKGLYEYVVSVKSLLDNLIKKIEKHHKCKKEFINYICTKRSDSLVEFDANSFNKVAFLCSIDDCYVLVTIMIEDYFPETKPTVSFQLATCDDVIILDDYPYSPRWSNENILERLISHLSDVVIKLNRLEPNNSQE